LEKATILEDPPGISVNRSNLNFGAIKEGPDSTSSSTSFQTLLINNSGGGTLNWEVTANGDWLICSPRSGTNSGVVKIYNGDSYVGDAVFVEGARPDVEQAYPDHPLNYRAGWEVYDVNQFLT
jgi:hypothetical protein